MDKAAPHPSAPKSVIELDMTAPPRPEPNLRIVPSTEWKGYRWRAIGDTVYYRPTKETFHEFLIYFLIETISRGWFKRQLSLSHERRHTIVSWYLSFMRWKESIKTDEHYIPEKDAFGATPSGDAKSLLLLAYDIFCLRVSNILSARLIKRLKDHTEYQGARYEIAVAALVARAGFDIRLLDEDKVNTKHCEFIATHKQSGIEIGVEAKSRQRSGVLHKNGEFNYLKAIRGDVQSLFYKALTQKPNDLPFIIFIDLNSPPTPHIPLESKPWFGNVIDIANRSTNKDRRHAYNMVVFTNFSYHYGGNDGPFPFEEYIRVASTVPQTQIFDDRVLTDIFEGVERYPNIPENL